MSPGAGMPGFPPADPATRDADGSGNAPRGPDVLCLVGPTASGKSAVGIELARAIGGEVVNADAFQVYRGMDIGTAKVPEADRHGVPHHLIDVLDIAEELSVAAYQRVGRAVLRDLGARGTPAVVVGGSGLYVRALLDDLRFPGSDPDVRRRWQEQLDVMGAPALHAVLASRDPRAAAHILPSNGRRIVRALEVGEITGEPFIAELPVAGPPLVPHLSIGLDVPRNVLDARIEDRVDSMLSQGLVAEVRHLLDVGLRAAPTASRALGYPQVIALIDGVLAPQQAREAIITATRRYARRQERWFRRDPRTDWVPASGDPSSTADAILARWRTRPRRLDA